MKQELWRVSVGMITITDIANRDKIKIKVKQGEIKEQDRKEKSFSMIFCMSPFVSKPLPSAIQSPDLLLFCLYFRCSLSRLISALKKKNVPASEALWDWAQWANIPSLHLFSLLPVSLWDGNRQVWHLQLLLCTEALSSGVPSVPSKAREERKAEWEEKKIENLLLPLLLLSSVPAGEDFLERPWLLPVSMGKCWCPLSHHSKSMGKLSSWNNKKNLKKSGWKRTQVRHRGYPRHCWWRLYPCISLRMPQIHSNQEGCSSGSCMLRSEQQPCNNQEEFGESPLGWLYSLKTFAP